MVSKLKKKKKKKKKKIIGLNFFFFFVMNFVSLNIITELNLNLLKQNILLVSLNSSVMLDKNIEHLDKCKKNNRSPFPCAQEVLFIIIE